GDTGEELSAAAVAMPAAVGLVAALAAGLEDSSPLALSEEESASGLEEPLQSAAHEPVPVPAASVQESETSENTATAAPTVLEQTTALVKGVPEVKRRDQVAATVKEAGIGDMVEDIAGASIGTATEDEVGDVQVDGEVVPINTSEFMKDEAAAAPTTYGVELGDEPPDCEEVVATAESSAERGDTEAFALPAVDDSDAVSLEEAPAVAEPMVEGTESEAVRPEQPSVITSEDASADPVAEAAASAAEMDAPDVAMAVPPPVLDRASSSATAETPAMADVPADEVAAMDAPGSVEGEAAVAPTVEEAGSGDEAPEYEEAPDAGCAGGSEDSEAATDVPMDEAVVPTDAVPPSEAEASAPVAAAQEETEEA
ncbi:unnamed protein product, partial [Pylaiella littoralis]